MVKIDKGIPIPHDAKRKTKYPWTELEIGESFAYDGPMNAAKTHCKYSSEKHKKLFDARLSRGEIRVWRLA